MDVNSGDHPQTAALRRSVEGSLAIALPFLAFDNKHIALAALGQAALLGSSGLGRLGKDRWQHSAAPGSLPIPS